MSCPGITKLGMVLHNQYRVGCKSPYSPFHVAIYSHTAWLKLNNIRCSLLRALTISHFHVKKCHDSIRSKSGNKVSRLVFLCHRVYCAMLCVVATHEAFKWLVTGITERKRECSHEEGRRSTGGRRRFEFCNRCRHSRQWFSRFHLVGGRDVVERARVGRMADRDNIIKYVFYTQLGAHTSGHSLVNTSATVTYFNILELCWCA